MSGEIPETAVLLVFSFAHEQSGFDCSPDCTKRTRWTAYPWTALGFPNKLLKFYVVSYCRQKDAGCAEQLRTIIHVFKE